MKVVQYANPVLYNKDGYIYEITPQEVDDAHRADESEVVVITVISGVPYINDEDQRTTDDPLLSNIFFWLRGMIKDGVLESGSRIEGYFVTPPGSSKYLVITSKLEPFQEYYIISNSNGYYVNEKGQLNNPKENVAFSVRSIADNYHVRDTKIKGKI